MAIKIVVLNVSKELPPILIAGKKRYECNQTFFRKALNGSLSSPTHGGIPNFYTGYFS